MKRPSYPHPIIAREGWGILAGSGLVSLLVLAWSPWASLPFWLFTVFALQFFRDPVRSAPDGVGLVLSPADGRIVAVEEACDPYAQDRAALKISVFMNVFNVHSNRVPVEGQVRSLAYFAGRYFNASLDKASLENERNAMVLETAQGLVTVVQVAGLVARRILCHVEAGQHVYAGQRYGFIRFGSRVDVYLPPQSRPRVAIGDRVQATTSVLAWLPTDPGSAPCAPDGTQAG